MPSLDPILTENRKKRAGITNRKRLFIGLVTATSIVASFILIMLWLIPYIGFTVPHPAVPWLLGMPVFIAVVFILWASLSLTVKIIFGRSPLFFKWIWGVTIKILLPLMMIIGKRLGISKNRIRSSFVAVNNEFVESENKTYAPDKILLLMPMCLQNSKCNRRLIFDLNQCKRCGKCPVTGLLELSDKYGIYLAIATGGTIARRIVLQRRPELILACACERDLSSGIQDTYPISVYGILNSRPHGPCIDTLVSLERLEQKIKSFLSPAGYLPCEQNVKDEA